MSDIWTISVCRKKDRVAVAILRNSRMHLQQTYKMDWDEGTLKNQYISLLKAYIHAVHVAHTCIANNVTLDTMVVLECKNKNMRLWIDNGCSTRSYRELFDKFLWELNRLPVQYIVKEPLYCIADHYIDTVTEDAKQKMEEVVFEGTEEEVQVDMKLKEDYDGNEKLTSFADMFK